jgi:hypothetical protein
LLLPFAGVDHGLGVLLADVDPVGADECGRRLRRAHVDLDDVDAFVLGLLDQLRVGLHVGVVDHDHCRLLGDERGEGLRAGVGVPVRVAHDDLDARGLELALQAGGPAFGEVEAHRDRDEAHGLAGQRLLVALAERFIQALALRESRAGGGEREALRPAAWRPAFEMRTS